MERIRVRFGILGILCLSFIIPIKALRWAQLSIADSMIVGVAPSLLAPAGFMFLILASSGRLSRLTLPQLTMSMAIVSLLVEFGQLLPRPGMLAHLHYTFDWLDIAASVMSVSVAYLLALCMRKNLE
jgi:hypothetical protein